MSSNLLKQSLAAIETLQARLESSERAMREPIAIIGAACRYPGGANDPDGLWRIARDGVNAIGPMLPGRGAISESSQRGGFLPDLDQFDPLFFGISPREAHALDPQHRLLLETSYEALERAGLAVGTLAGTKTGVFVGITLTDYAELQIADRRNADPYVANGGALSTAAGRISFVFGFEGPSIAIDTACSSSLVSVHLAVQSLRTRETDLALAGGVNVILRPIMTALLSRMGLMAGDDACKPFDAAADGFVRSEGCGLIALKRLSDARAGGDPILAIIRGTAVNSDGRSSGLTVPHGPSQEALIRTALASAGLQPADIDYVEAHGTGTALGDPIEMEALARALARGRAADRPLLVGALKSNIGHAESAAGIAGLLKTVMALRHGQVPPTLHLRNPSPRIAWDEIAVRVPTSLTPWLRGEQPRRAGVSGFGFSGTNAHVILEEAPEPGFPIAQGPESADHGPLLVPFSARGEAALRALASRHADYLATNPAVTLPDYVVTMGQGRSPLPNRLGVIAGSLTELADSLRHFAAGAPAAGATEGVSRTAQRPKVAFLFTGQGAQYPGMGYGLYRTEPVFRTAIDRCAALLAGRLDRPLTDLMFQPGDSASATAALSETRYTQPALFALEYALTELWRSRGVVPQLVVGHSVGEYVAACVAGVVSLEDGLGLIAERGRLMHELPAGGAMAAVFAPEAAVVERLVDGVSVAAVNGPLETVISGEAAGVASVLEALARCGFSGRPLEVSHAFHSALLDPILDAFEARCARVTSSPPRLPLLSNLTGKPHPAGAVPDAHYWRRHAREPVRFADCIAALQAAGVTTLLEVGPHPTLLRLALQAAPEASWTGVSSLRRGRDDRRELQSALASLYAAGVNLVWHAEGGRRLALPTYPFQRTRYWTALSSAQPRAETTPAEEGATTRRNGHPWLGERQLSPAAGAQFVARLARHEPSFLADHVVRERVLMPFTGFVEMALAAARAAGMAGDVTVARLSVEKPLEIGGDERRYVHTGVTPADGGLALVISSAPAESPAGEPNWQRHVTGSLLPGRPRAMNGCPSFGTAAARCADAIDVRAFYASSERNGAALGPAFRCLRVIRLGDGVGVAEVSSPHDASSEPGVLIHPGVLDAVSQLVRALLAGPRPEASGEVLMPVSLGEMILTAAPTQMLRVVARITEAGSRGEPARADARLETPDGTVVALLNDLVLRPMPLAGVSAAQETHGAALRSMAVRWRGAVGAVPPLSGRYVVLGDAAESSLDFARQLAAAVQGEGLPCVVLECTSGLESTTVVTAAITHTLKGEPGLVVDCRALGPSDNDTPAGARGSYLRGLAIVKAVADAGAGVGLCVLARGSLAAEAGDDIALASTVLPGLVRTAAAEYPDRPMLLGDMDPGQSPDSAQALQLLKALTLTQPEAALRGGRVLVPALEGLRPSEYAGPGRQVLEFPEGGVLGSQGDPVLGRRGGGPPSVPVRADGTYLVSGGLGGIGLEAARWLVDRGAGAVILLGRRPPNERQRAALAKLRASGGRVDAIQCDVADPAALRALRTGPLALLPPVRGVLHAAGVLADAPLGAQDALRFQTVAHPKVDGARHLHAFTLDDPLEAFVLFSSVSATFGAPGQANYAAANAYLDGFAAWRRSQGLPALSVAWGLWDTDGMATALSPAAQLQIARKGMGRLDPRAAFDALESVPRAEHSAVIAALDLERLRAQARAGLGAFLAGGRTAVLQNSPPAAPSPEVSIAKPPPTLSDFLVGELARVLGFDRSTLDLDTPLPDLGFDSMMAIQVRNVVTSQLGLDVPLRTLLAGATIGVLVDLVKREAAADFDPSARISATVPVDESLFEEGVL